MPLENLDDLEASWSEWMIERNAQGKLTQGAAWRRDNSGEWGQLSLYKYGTGPRPTLATHTGRQMVELVDALIEARGTVEPTPTPTPTPVPVGGKLAFRPPTLENPMVVTLNNNPNLVINGNGGDIYVNPGFHRSVPWGSTVNQVITFQNYRHLIMRAIRQTVNYGSTDDGSNRHGMVFQNSTGHTFLEGVLWDGGPLRSFIIGEGVGGATFTFQNTRIVGTRDNRLYIGGNFQHSDIMMHWGEGNIFQVDMATWEYDNTGIAYYDGSNNSVQGPNKSDLRRVNLRSIHNSSQAFAYIVSQNQESWAQNCWATTGYYQSTQKPLQDCMGRYNDVANPGQSLFTPYTITRPSTGAKLVMNTLTEHNNGGSLNQMGRQTGDYLWRNHPKLANERWTWGIPPGGDFVPQGVAGINYASPGYV